MKLPPLLAALPMIIVFAVPASAAPPRALPAGERPADSRLEALKNLNGYFPFHEVETAEQWERRRAELRRRVRVATGLWPWPKRTPLNPVVHGRTEHDGYTIEKVILEAVPGHYVTGNLYRPAGENAERNVVDGRRPAVLSPHGHWSGGRFYDAAEQGGVRHIRRQIARGAERFEEGGRSPLQARCVQLARMGCVVFHYDMIGYADSVQLEHRPGVRDHMNSTEDWGFFSPQAELRLQNMMGQQTWNSIRALDFLLSLEEVDPERIAVTGASGGGTQTFMLGAIDDRPDVLFPAVMVSTAMQGGCTCENAPHLRVDGGNIDLAALAAPRPLGMTGADDWTAEIEEKGLPELESLYAMLDHGERVFGEAITYFGHNYNSVSRTLMYDFLNRHFDLGFEEPVLERDYPFQSAGELSVWNDEHPEPTGEAVGDSHERTLLRWWTRDSRERIGELIPGDKASLTEYRRVIGGAWRTLIGRSLEDIGDVRGEQTEELREEDYALELNLVRVPAKSEQLPTFFVHPLRAEWNGRTVLWLTDEGKAGLLTEAGEPKPEVKRLIDAGYQVIGVDLFMQGEFVEDGRSVEGQRMWHQGDGSAPWHRYAGYTFGYNPSLFARRVHDALTIVRLVQARAESHPGVPSLEPHLVGTGRVAGPVALAAAGQADGAVKKVAADCAGFRFADITRLDHPMMVPGAVKYGGIDGLASLAAPGELWIAGVEEEQTRATRAVCEAAGHRDRLTISDTTGEARAEGAVDWLLE